MAVTKPKSPNFEKTKLKLLERDFHNEARTAVENERNLRASMTKPNLRSKEPTIPMVPVI